MSYVVVVLYGITGEDYENIHDSKSELVGDLLLPETGREVLHCFAVQP